MTLYTPIFLSDNERFLWIYSIGSIDFTLHFVHYLIARAENIQNTESDTGGNITERNCPQNKKFCKNIQVPAFLYFRCCEKKAERDCNSVNETLN